MSNNVNLNKSNTTLNLEEFKNKIVTNHKEIKTEITSKKEQFLKTIENAELYKTTEKMNSEINAEIKETINNIATEYQNTEAKITKYIESVFDQKSLIDSDSASNALSSSQNSQTYELSEQELEAIAYVCYKEQEIAGAKGAADEASLMANRYELYADKEKYPTLYDYVRDCKWWAKSKSRMDNPGDVSPEVEAAVYEVLVEGNRTLPEYVDEHDWENDITRASNNGVEISVDNRDAYISGVTVLENKWGAKYTFYAFAGGSGDPMGYTSNALRNTQNS